MASRQDWEKVVAEFKRSGQSQIEFARRRGVAISTLQYWVRKLRRETTAEIALLPVSIAEHGRFVEARSGDISLRFEVGTDVQYVIELLRRLTTSC